PEVIAVRPPQPGAGRGGAPGAAPGGGRGGGRGGPPGPPGSGTPGSSFSRPADVAWDRAGNIYVGDGIGTNNRVAKFDKEGAFLKHWGSTGSGPGKFNGVKALAIDNQGSVYVADMGNKRIQVFDAEGTFKSEFTNIGTPLAMCITRGSPQYLYISHAGDEDGMEDAAIYKVQLDGKVVGKFGSAGKLPKEFGLANSLDCRSETELLIGEMTNWRVQKVTLKR
ncbi:MAG: 6-bladed beta-propeller, partial [Acidobacteria bacterium]|nr:6-bladed beta-propeller [Acidobacteriota bacterium]